MPHVWNVQAVTEGLNVIRQCRFGLLVDFKDLLDSYHGEPRSLAYYDLLAGDWLESFVHLTYVAWREVLAGNVAAERRPIPVSSDLSAYARLSWQESGLHEHLRWAVARILEGDSPKSWNFESESALISSGGGERLQLRLLRGMAVAKPDVLVVLPDYKCSHSEWASALWHWRRWLALDNLQYPIRVTAQLDIKWRRVQAIAVGAAANLNEVLRVLLPLHLPVALLEGFADYRSAVLAFPVARPKAIYSANALHTHLPFKLLTAEWRQQGTQLLYHQHGGGYGIDRVHSIEEFETRVSDRYYTWGWRCQEPCVRPLSAPLLNTPRRVRNKFLLICSDFPRVVYRLHFQPMSGSIQIMHRETCEFLAALPDCKNWLIRPNPHEYGWGSVDMMRRTAPNAAFDDYRVSSLVRYAESRLVVHSYLGTSWLETLALDIPTVCFFDPDTYVFRDEAQPWIDALERVGILHRSGKVAAQFVANLGNAPEGWWAKPDVQDARQNFVEHYANFATGWKSLWEIEFRSVLDTV